MSSPGVKSNSTPGPKRTGALPPEEKFWQRYSPHHEFPLSSLSSVCLYVLGGLLIWAVVALAMKQSDDLSALPVGEIGIAPGGGGNPDGEGDKGPGDRPVENRKEAVRDVKPDANPSPTDIADKKLRDVTSVPVKLPDLQDDSSSRIIDESTEAVERFAGISKNARDQLFKGLGPVSKGAGGSGEGGGKGSGIGKGKGSGVGEGTGTLNVRQKRILRWVMLFRTEDGHDYLIQLRELGAILAIPDPAGGGYLVIHDLSRRPAKPVKEDLEQIKRIFWVDNKPESVASLFRALNLPTPPHFVAFFPVKLEEELLKKELAYRGLKEDEIEETRFKVVRGARGYEAVVDGQRRK